MLLRAKSPAIVAVVFVMMTNAGLRQAERGMLHEVVVGNNQPIRALACRALKQCQNRVLDRQRIADGGSLYPARLRACAACRHFAREGSGQIRCKIVAEQSNPPAGAACRRNEEVQGAFVEGSKIGISRWNRARV